MSVSRSDPDQRVAAAPKPAHSRHFALGPGHMQAAPIRKSVVSVGRHASRCYCPTCGQKRAACRCEATDA